MGATKIITEWFGDLVEKEVIEALKEGVNESIDQIFRDADSTVKVRTGHLKSSGKKIPAKVGRKEVYGRVNYGAKYAAVHEYKTFWLRQALMKNENSSLLNFEGRLGYGKRKIKK